MADLAKHMFDCTGAEQTYTVPVDGWYRLETWGAQGASTWGNGTTCRGGYGGYSTGVVYLKKNTLLHIYVGGSGNKNEEWASYNGGAKGIMGEGFYGGGASHIALVSGLLSTLESQQDKLLIVAGGGGGSEWDGGDGGDGGGIQGGDGHQGTLPTNGAKSPTPVATGGTQSSGGTSTPFYPGSKSTLSGSGTFGLGNGFFGGDSGGYGGGGFYGGGGSDYAGGGGGGSGYIGHVYSLCGVTRHMAGYNVQTSSADATRTISVTNVSATATVDYAKIGNGAASVQLLMPDINKLYLSPNGTAKRPRNALILGDGTAHHINKLYLGDSNNKPKLVWVNYT